ncbi:redoxin domain-containing protein, partial [Treponema pallidum]
MESLIGKRVIDFKLPAYVGGKFTEVSNASIKGSWAVFMFYPADFTFVCPTELADLARVYPSFVEIGCKVYSVSTDSEYVHKAWADATDTIKNLPYEMISDKAGKLAGFFGVLLPDTWHALRGTFVVDPEGLVKAFEVHDMGIGRDADELLRKVQSAQFVAKHGDQVCPARWKPGAKTLKPGI